MRRSSMSSKPDFDVGDLVACIRQPEGSVHTISWDPTVGSTYTVVELGVCDDDSWGINLAEDPQRLEDSLFEAAAFRKQIPLNLEIFKQQEELV